jgi:plastocyanin
MTGIPTAMLSSLALAGGLLSLGCGDSGGTPPGANVAKVSGDEQVAIVGQALTDPLVVQVTSDGAPSAGTTVTWSTTSPGGALDPSSSVTDANGMASTGWALGTVSGRQSTTATLSGGSLTTFMATALADAATAVTKASGDEQIAEVGSQLALPVQARVTDQHGNGVQGIAVGWAATGGTVSSPSVTSDAAGLSSVTVTAGGAVGPIVITATAVALSGSPLTFNATAVVTGTAPATAAVTVSNNLFRSNRNATTNPAVDTVAVDGTVTWTWVNTGITTHSVASEGSPSFTSSELLTTPGQSYSFTFVAPGTYQYTCAVHPSMTGRVVVR